MRSTSILPKVVLGLPSRNKDVVAFAKNVLASFTTNSKLFPSPTPTLAVFGADIAAFDQAETVPSKDPAETAQRDALRARVVQDLLHLCDYVQGVVETTTDDPVTVITSASFRPRRPTTRKKPAFAANDGPVSGTVRLQARAVAVSAIYYWQYSLDDKTWTSVPETLQATTTIAGLTVGQTYAFRFRAITRAGAGDYSQAVTLMVR